MEQQKSSPNIKDQLTLGSFILLSVLMAFTSLSVDAYLPQLPQMRQDLQGNVELTITSFLIGFSIAQLFIGPISDKFGRKIPLLSGIFLFIVGSVGCATSQSLTSVIIWRVVQALGACSGPLLSRAMVRDLFGREKAAEVLSTLMLIMAIAPVLGPIIGGQLSWQNIFWFLASIGIIMFIFLFWLPESHPPERRNHASIGAAFAKYKILLTKREFMRYTLCVTFFYIGVYGFISGSPFVYITYFGVESENYGWLFAINTIGMMTVSFGNRFWVRKVSLDKLLQRATFISMIAGAALIFFTQFGMGGIFGILVSVFIYFSMNGVVAATTTAAALDDIPEMAGAGSALLGSLQYGSGILSSFLLSLFNTDSPATMGWIIGLAGIGSAIIMLSKPKRLLK